MEHKVFISKGSHCTPDQREFIDEVLNLLKTNGLSPRIMNENEWSHEQPLLAIRKIIQECSGLLVIAFPRMHFQQGLEVRNNGNRTIQDVALATPWNHIEAALAYSLKLPVLVVAEHGLKSEGLIEKGYDWNVYWTELNLRSARADGLKGLIQSWRKSVEEFGTKNPDAKTTGLDPEKLTIGQLVNALTVAQFWKLLAAILSVLTACMAASYKLGGGKWPWE